jgi:hypothetical protein
LAALVTTFVSRAQTGIPFTRIVYEHEGRYFHTHRAGPPHEFHERPSTEISKDAYETHCYYEDLGRNLWCMGVPLLMVLAARLIIRHRFGRKGHGAHSDAADVGGYP